MRSDFLCSFSQFAVQEDKRQKNERLHQHQKHENQMRDLQLQCDANVRELQQLQVKLHPNSDHSTRYWLYQTFKSCISVCVRMRNATCWLNTRPRNWRSWMRNRAWSWRSGGRSSDPGRRYYTVTRQEHFLLPFSSKVQIILLIYSSVKAVCVFRIIWMIMGSLEFMGFPESSETATLSVTFRP